MSQLPILKKKLRDANTGLEPLYQTRQERRDRNNHLTKKFKKEITDIERYIAGLEKEILQLETETPHGIV